MRPVLRRHRQLVAALVCALLAVLFVFVAFDARTWRTSVARDDVRFRALHTHTGLWSPRTSLPGDPVGHLIGTGSTLAWRRAVQAFWYSRVGKNPDTRGGESATLRADAQDRLLSELTSAPTDAQRSRAANLLGVLVVTTPTPGGDRAAIGQILKRAQTYFQQAIALDATDVEAKENLELVLRIRKPGKSRISQDARAGYGFGRGQGATNIGNGY
jgi:hypothetical protein